MASQRSRTVANEYLTTLPAGELFLRTSISYMGGDNYFSGKTDTRGYWLCVQPVTLLPDGVEQFRLTAGTRALLQPAARFSATALAKVVVPPTLLAGMRAKVVAEEVEENARNENNRMRAAAQRAAR